MNVTKTLVLEEQVSGNPRPVVQWFRNQEEIAVSERIMYGIYENSVNYELNELDIIGC